MTVTIKYFQAIPADVNTAAPDRMCKADLTSEGKLPVGVLNEKFGVTLLEEIRDGEPIPIGYDQNNLSYRTFTENTVVNVTGTPNDFAVEEVANLDCGNATQRQISAITGVVFSKIPWIVTPSDQLELTTNFKQEFQNICNIWGKRNESDRRQYIDCVLRHAVIGAGLVGKVRVHTEVKMNQLSQKRDSSGASFNLSGSADYAVTHDTVDAYEAEEILKGLRLVGVEARTNWQDKVIIQLSAYAGILHCKRKIENKSNKEVWGFVSNGLLWRFLRVTNTGEVETTDLYDIGDLRSVNWDKMRIVMATMIHVLNAAYCASPTGSVQNLAI